MRYTLVLIFIFTLLFSCENQKKSHDYDLIIYGGTSAGVIAAHSASKLGRKVLLISPDKHLGGLSSSGLGNTDIGNKYAVTGLSLDFYRRVGQKYGELEAWRFEPHVAEEVFNDFIDESGADVIKNYYLDSVSKSGTTISSVTVFDWDSREKKTFSAKKFIDASYTGDLLAAAGVSYTVGRESNEKYGETLNGVQLLDKHQFPPIGNENYHIDPYIVPGDSSSGLCYGISNNELQPNGTGDEKVQAYNYRLCLTQDTTNQVAFRKPDNYDPSKYELLKRVILEREKRGWSQNIGWFYLSINGVPNGKTDVNNKGPFSTDFIGMNYDYPKASYQERKAIELEHRKYIEGLLFYLSNHEELPDTIREQMSSWGFAADEFTDNENFPRKIYIREARRMIGEMVMTEHHCRGDKVVSDPVGMAAYTMDSHNCQRLVVEKDGKVMVKNEGDVQVGGFPPYPISYRSITPKKEECTNLLVPVALSASHIAYGSIRMEPVFMVLGQSAAIAASLAIENEVPVQEVAFPKIREILDENPFLDGRRKEFIIDDTEHEYVKHNDAWDATQMRSQYKTSALLSDSVNKESLKITLPTQMQGAYNVYYYVPEKHGRKENDQKYHFAENIEIKYTSGSKKVSLKAPVTAYGDWMSLGKIESNGSGKIEVIPSGESQHVFDALLLQPVE